MRIIWRDGAGDMQRIMLIRHAEKHHDGSPDRSVAPDGTHAKHHLTVRGWQRAGALVRYFAPPGGLPPGGPISTPTSIFASAATPKSPSLRAQHTVEPLAALLGVGINHDHADGEESALAPVVLAAEGPVLVSWHHSHLIRLTRAIAGPDVPCPRDWPDNRFDVVWVLDRDAPDAPWRFSQVAQQLFAYDRPEAL
jgi:phosphohistidine phosphatase SixA